MSAVVAAPSTSAARTTGDLVRAGLRGLGQLFITLGVIILLFVVYELYWTNLQTNADQNSLVHQIQRTWNPPTGHAAPAIDTVPIGGGIAVLYIPRFGKDWHPVVVQGTGYNQLVEGPGHWVDSAYPGQVGNFYVAGHRTTHSAPFNRLAELRKGDYVYVETAKAWYTYQLEDLPAPSRGTWQEIVSPNDIAVSYAVPDQPNARLTWGKRVLTFSTCNPEYSATQRLIVHGVLRASHPRGHGYRPAAVVSGPLVGG